MIASPRLVCGIDSARTDQPVVTAICTLDEEHENGGSSGIDGLVSSLSELLLSPASPQPGALSGQSARNRHQLHLENQEMNSRQR